MSHRESEWQNPVWPAPETAVSPAILEPCPCQASTGHGAWWGGLFQTSCVPNSSLATLALLLRSVETHLYHSAELSPPSGASHIPTQTPLPR